MSKPVVRYNICVYYKNLKTLSTVSLVNLIRRLHNIENNVYTWTSNNIIDKGKPCSSMKNADSLVWTRRKRNIFSLPVSNNACIFSSRVNYAPYSGAYNKYYSTNSTDINYSKFTFAKSGSYIFLGFSAITILALYQLVHKNEMNDVQEYFNEAERINNESERSPKTVNEIPDKVKYVIIGGGATAFSASRTIKSHDPKAKILLLTDESEYPYMRPPLSKEMFKSPNILSVDELQFVQWNGSSRSIYFENEEFYTPCERLKDSVNGGISIARGWRVTAIDPNNKTITLKDGKQIKYHKCLIATGSTPLKLPFLDSKPENIREKVTYYNSLSDFKFIERLLAEDVKTIAIYGSGLLGSELASSLLKKVEDSHMKTNIVQIIEGTFVLQDFLPDYLCKWLTQDFEEKGIIIIKECMIKDILLEDNKLNIILSNGMKVVADHLLACLGATPNTEIAKASGLEIDSVKGGFLVNSELLARTDLYAAGDCASFYDNITGERQVVTHYDHAIASGQVAGENMVNAGKPFTHHAGFWSEFCSKVGFEAVGNINPELRTFGFFTPSQAENHQITEVNNQLEPPDGSTKGVIFYVNESKIVEGIVLWNLFNQLPTARQVIASREPYNDLMEVLKHFDLFVEDDL